MPLSILAGVFAGLSLAVHLGSHALAARAMRARPAQPQFLPPISLVRPLRGVEHGSQTCVDAAFALTYPDFELLFCVAQAGDPIIALVEDAMARHPHVRARLLVMDERGSGNPKLDNVAKGYRAATGDIVVFADSNLLTPPDYLQHVVAAFADDVAIVSAPPFADDPQSFWAETECALLNGYAARWQYAVDALGFGFAQGKTLAFRKRDLDAGAFHAMADEPAEDAAATKWARAQGRRVRLVAPPFPQKLGARRLRDVWARHLRWARLRRATFPLLFAPEILTSGYAPALAAFWAGGETGAAFALFVLAIWYGADAWLARAQKWPLSWRAILALPCRDAMLAAIWCAAWAGRDFTWHGHAMRAEAPTRAHEAA